MCVTQKFQNSVIANTPTKTQTSRHTQEEGILLRSHRQIWLSTTTTSRPGAAAASAAASAAAAAGAQHPTGPGLLEW